MKSADETKRRQEGRNVQGNETATIVAPLVEALNKIPDVWARRIHSGKVKSRGGGWVNFGASGAPDVFCLALGAPIFFEAKKDKGKATEVQEREHQRIRSAGGAVHVIHSPAEGIAIVMETLEAVR